MSDTKARELGLTPLARIVSTGGVSGLSPEIMGLGPIEAITRALAKAGKTISDIDLVEINEAFAVQVIGSARELGIDEDKLNVSGGAIALGHPFGMTGARITATLLNNLATYDKTFGIESMCVAAARVWRWSWSDCPDFTVHWGARACDMFAPPRRITDTRGTMTTLGTPLSAHATRVMLLGSGELGREVLIALQRLASRPSPSIATTTRPAIRSRITRAPSR